MNKTKKKKRCGACKKRLPVESFHKDKTAKDSFCYWCKSCASEYSKRYNQSKKGKKVNRKGCQKFNKSEKGRKANRKYHQSERGKATCRKLYLKYTYDITVTQYVKLFKQQKGCCAICKRPQSDFKRRLAVDHSHKTGKVRGLLCTKCNTRLDWHFNNKKVIINYLKGKK